MSDVTSDLCSKQALIPSRGGVWTVRTQSVMIDTMARATVRIAVTLLVVVASATVCAAASSRPSKTTSAPAAGKKYISKRYGYSIVLRGKYVLVQPNYSGTAA